ncbi:MAG: hypothetical protein DME96_08695 [Verrucomicrobia bacterium]|nr:MAG: hypothetical protein DME96_08695 [Verrucomicrobiota bacterium]
MLASGDQTFSPLESASVPRSREPGENARCRVRIGKNLIQHQQVTLNHPQIAPQISDIEKQQLAQLFNAWPKLSNSLKAAILTIAGFE